MDVLVTGGAGFIGSNLVPVLLASGHRVRVLDNLSVAPPRDVPSCDLELVVGDVRDRPVVEGAVKGIDAVVHLAAQTNVQRSLEAPREDFEINAEGTLTLLEASARGGVRKFVFASSNAAVGQAEGPIHEGLLARPLSPYGASKLAGESYCVAFYHAYGLETATLRFANAYGPLSSHKTSVVARFFREGLEKGVLTVYGDGRQTRDFVYVDDVCQAILACIDKDSFRGEVFQIGSGRETQVLDLAEKVKSLIEGSPIIQFLPARNAEIVRNVSNIEKVRQVLGWDPRTSLDDGLVKTSRWFRHDPLAR